MGNVLSTIGVLAAIYVYHANRGNGDTFGDNAIHHQLETAANNHRTLGTLYGCFFISYGSYILLR